METPVSYSSFSKPTPALVEVVGIMPRFIAYLIDSVVLSLIAVGVAVVFIVLGAQGGEPDPASVLIAIVISLLINVVYFIGFWAAGGQTLGKMVMGQVIVGDDGRPIGIVQALMRFMGYLVSGFVMSIGFAWIAFDDRKQGWHDKIASTVVVRKSDLDAAQTQPTFVANPSGMDKVWVAIYYVLNCIVPFILSFLSAMMQSQISPR